MKKIISFSIWGDNERYTLGAIQNLKLANIYYPDWICRFYINVNVNKNIVNALSNNSEIIIIKEQPNWSSTLWRFHPAGEKDVDFFISRDADSRLSLREKYAVEEWIDSGKGSHIMRDHPYHARPIMAGMWGARRGAIPNMIELLSNYKKNDDYESDQKFLAAYIYPIIKNNSIVHDEFFERQPFPKKSKERIPAFHVGQAYSGNGNVLDTTNYGEQSYIRYIKENEGIEL